MTRTVSAANVIREQEIGLLLPDGTRIFPPEEWHHRPITNSVDRDAILQTLRVAAANLGYPEEEFLGKYQWVTRDKITATMYEDGDTMPITSTGHLTIIADDRIPVGGGFGYNPDMFNGEEAVNPDAFQPDVVTTAN